MDAAGRRADDPLRRRGVAAPPTIADRLYAEGYAFDFFQAVRLLNRLAPGRAEVGQIGPPSEEVVRFRAHNSLAFPPSAIHDLIPPTSADGPPTLVQAFLGLTGPSGVLPRHYTELVLRLEKDQRGPERRALRDWFDLFNHRFTSLFYRAWTKYRTSLAHEKAEAGRADDPITRAFFSLIGLGTPGLLDRLRVDDPAAPAGRAPLAKVDDRALIYYAGLLSHRPRSAIGLEAILHDYFQLRVEILQFCGDWLQIEPSSMTQLAEETDTRQLGVNAIAGERIWDVEGKIRVRLGPLGLDQFREFLPLTGPDAGRHSFAIMGHLIRLYIGPQLAFDVQLVLRAEEVPEIALPVGDATGPALGWDTWLRSQPFNVDADDAVFAG